MTRRDYTNASGYFCPTENTAIYLADREPQPKGAYPNCAAPSAAIEALRLEIVKEDK